MRIQNNKGFTLIELMVVISIIGLLSSIVLASLKDARDKANVTKFKEEIRQMISALELYRGDNGKYPYEGQSYYYVVKNNNTSDYNPGDLDLFSPTYLSKYMKTEYFYIKKLLNLK
jgi:type II secretion system protein G